MTTSRRLRQAPLSCAAAWIPSPGPWRRSGHDPGTSGVPGAARWVCGGLGRSGLGWARGSGQAAVEAGVGRRRPAVASPLRALRGRLAPGGGSDWPSPGVSGGVREEFQSRAWAGNERAGESGARAPAVMQGRAAAYLPAQRRKESGIRNTATLLAFSAPAALASGFGVAERGQRRVRGALWKVVVDRHC